MIKIGINGFGRIGRSFFRKSFNNPNIEVVAANDLGDINNLAYLLKYDSVYGQFDQDVRVEGDKIIAGDKQVTILSEKEPGKLPWGDLGVDIVIESTGFFKTLEKAQPHLDAGAKRVIISAPAKDDIVPTTTPGVANEMWGQQKITSNASCTTNAVSPVMAVMSVNPGVKKALLSTVHGYTSTQSTVDGPSGKDFRKGRAAAVNMIPTTTGAAIATTKGLPHLEGKFDGIAVRVPVVSGSIIDVTFVAKKSTSVEEINNIFKEQAASDQWKGILGVTEEPLVSTDILGSPHGSIVDLAMTRVIDGDLVKVMAWYDNEWGYVAMLEKHVETVGNML